MNTSPFPRYRVLAAFPPRHARAGVHILAHGRTLDDRATAAIQRARAAGAFRVQLLVATAEAPEWRPLLSQWLKPRFAAVSAGPARGAQLELFSRRAGRRPAPRRERPSGATC